MTLGNMLLLGTALVLGVLLLNPKTMRNRAWRATVTPLASIIGSGFLVAGPILSQVAGHWAFAAMMGLCALGYFYGAAIRYNIRHVEPRIGKNAPPMMQRLEQASDLALSFAYFVSVAYYLNLFAAFALRGGGVIDAVWVKLLATAVIAAVGVLGALRGLGALERVEAMAVGTKLALIGGLCTALLGLSLVAFSTGDLTWPTLDHDTGLNEVQVLLGLVILVQGFETSRYLGAEYDADLRIASMRWAQGLATLIYLVFVLLITRYFTNDLSLEGGETAIIDMLAPVGTLVAPAIIILALASQLSAAVADMNGAGGLISETSRKRLPVKLGYAVTAAAAILITWLGNIYEIITYASKAFVLYYGLQSLQAALAASGVKRWLFAFGVLLALVIIFFATPASV